LTKFAREKNTEKNLINCFLQKNQSRRRKRHKCSYIQIKAEEQISKPE
jgi:hypothetical protein